jgi:thiamine phosphate synthase YjbQ (UPF0047 family)
MESEIITVRTGSSPAVVDITAEAAAFVSDRGDGLLHVFVPHATAGVAIIETGAGSDGDLLNARRRPPADGRWRHRHGSPGHGRSPMPAFVAAHVAGAGRAVSLGVSPSARRSATTRRAVRCLLAADALPRALPERCPNAARALPERCPNAAAGRGAAPVIGRLAHLAHRVVIER